MLASSHQPSVTRLLQSFAALRPVKPRHSASKAAALPKALRFAAVLGFFSLNIAGGEIMVGAAGIEPTAFVLMLASSHQPSVTRLLQSSAALRPVKPRHSASKADALPKALRFAAVLGFFYLNITGGGK